MVACTAILINALCFRFTIKYIEYTYRHSNLEALAAHHFSFLARQYFNLSCYILLTAKL